MFIVIEGGDGSSKNTQAELLADYLTGLGHTPRVYSFPRDTFSGRAARACMVPEKVKTKKDFNKAYLTQCAMMIDRFEFLPTLRENERDGIITIAVRWTPSALVYGWVDGCNLTWLGDSQRELPVGHVNILLDVPLQTAMTRIDARGITKERYETEEFQTKVLLTYRRLWRNRMQAETCDARWFKVDASRTKETIAKDIRRKLAPILTP